MTTSAWLVLVAFGALFIMAWFARRQSPRVVVEDVDDEPREDALGVIEIDEEIDLHGFRPKEIPAVVESYLEAAAEKGLTEVRLIHGRGKGVQRRRVQSLLERHPRVQRVYYPGLRAHAQHALARRQMDGFGGIVTFDVGTLARARRVGKRLKIGTPAESLGGVETIVSHPATMSHAGLSPRERRRQGIGPGLLRLSVGVEAVEDLIDDLEWALGS